MILARLGYGSIGVGTQKDFATEPVDQSDCQQTSRHRRHRSDERVPGNT